MCIVRCGDGRLTMILLLSRPQHNSVLFCLQFFRSSNLFVNVIFLMQNVCVCVVFVDKQMSFREAVAFVFYCRSQNREEK